MEQVLLDHTGHPDQTDPAAQDAPDPRVELGRWLGRNEAFDLIAKKCSAAQAHCLKELRESKRYESLGIDWEQFCARYLGIHRATADRLIQRLEEFGAAYFNLAQVMRISPDTFRQIAGAVTEETIDFGEEKIPLTRQNARRISAAVEALRQQLLIAEFDIEELAQRSKLPTPELERKHMLALRTRLDICLKDLLDLAHAAIHHDQRLRVAEVVDHGIRRLENIRTVYSPIDHCVKF